jgi:peptidoglycan hydrolase-like protein with peptidoglycan-binding domain
MNKKHVFYVLLALFFALPVSVLASFDRDLSYGSRGTDVSDLQKFLTERGIYRGPVTGNFYNLTKAAVIEFQNKEGIAPAAGYFGPLTRKKANSLLGQSSPNAQGTTSQTQTAAIPATGNTIMRIPNGPVVEIDASGKIVRWIEGWPQIPAGANPSPTANTDTSPQLLMTLGTISTTENSAYVSWTSNIPSESKILWGIVGSAMMTVTPSEAGKSTQHLVHLTGLAPSTNYSFSIEGISGSQGKKILGFFTSQATPAMPAPTTPIVSNAHFTNSIFGPIENNKGDQWLGNLRMTLTNESVILKSLKFTVSSSNSQLRLDNVGLSFGSGLVAGPQDQNDSNTFTFTDPITFPTLSTGLGYEGNLTMVGRVANGHNGESVTISTNPAKDWQVVAKSSGLPAVLPDMPVSLTFEVKETDNE